MQTHKPATATKPEPGRALYDKQRSNGRTLALDGKAWRTLRAAVCAGGLCECCMRRE